jgi:hypothetical protein
VTAAIAVVVAVVVVVTMAIDHWFGTESEPGESAPVDPATFVISTGVALALTALLFLLVVKPAPAERAARRAIVCSALAVVTLPVLWLALPFPFAGASLALGLGARGRLGTAAAIIGALILVLGLIAYVVAGS